jgi:hypothetical protein
MRSIGHLPADCRDNRVRGYPARHVVISALVHIHCHIFRGISASGTPTVEPLDGGADDGGEAVDHYID